MSKKREAKEFTNNHYKPFTAKNEKQKQLFNYLNSFSIVIAQGSAGTGKTACVISKACEYLHDDKIDKIVISRPSVESGESLGSLPGELEDKFLPYLVPVREIMDEILGKSHVTSLIKHGKIVGVPLGYCRGRSFNNSFVILDEAQNASPEQMKMFLTRIGLGSKMAITGDVTQPDIRGDNGLADAIKRISWMPQVKVIKFSKEDVVRNVLISDILSSYEN